MKKYFLIALLPLALASCLKDKKYDDMVYGMNGTDSGKLIELPASPENTISLEAADRDTTFSVVAVRLNSAEAAKEDIKVKLELAPGLLADFNDANGTDFVELDPSDYSLDNLEVTIPRGSREGYIKMTVNPQNILDADYAMPFTIASVSNAGYTISANYQGVVTIIGVKNKYDGRYEVTGSCVDANGLYQGAYPQVIDLITASGSSVICYFVDFDYPNYIVQNIATLGYANTGIKPRYNFDASDAVISGLNANNNAPFTAVSGQFHAADKSMTVTWTSGRWLVTESYEYIGPRP